MPETVARADSERRDPARQAGSALGGPSRWGGWLARHERLLFPGALIAAVLVIVVPLPAWLLDLLLSANITLAVLVLLTTIYVSTPLEFAVFPSLLLATTLLRLVLNVASTRLILARGAIEGTSAAGGVIQGFGEFVAGDRVAIGLIIFVILVIIQFVVITKGATRISEVAARFALDGMPGRQMAIDADLNAGLIDEKEAKARREQITRQADFYGAMDGASKFVRGDAIAGILITLTNILGGLYVGMVDTDPPMAFGEAVDVFTKLTIGDGLVTQVPAFLISIAAGLIVTRSTSASDLPRDVVSQVFAHPQALAISAGFLGLLAFTNLPAVPLLALGGGCGGISLVMSRARRQAEAEARRREQAREAEKPPPRIEDHLHVDPMEVEIGYGLIRLADPKKGGDLLDRVQRVRQNVAQDLGIVLPKVRIRDNLQLGPHEYRIKIRDVPVAHATVYADRFLAMDSGATTGRIAGTETTEPAFGMPAVWIEGGRRDEAQMLGYHVVEPSSVIATHLTEIIRKHADELLTREQVKRLLDRLKETSPTLVEDLVPAVVKPGQLQQVMANLLRERVPVRDLETVLETMGDYAARLKDLDADTMTEFVRHRLARIICHRYRDAENRLRVLTLDPALEDTVAAGASFTDRGLVVKLSPKVAERIARGIAAELEKFAPHGAPPVVLCSPQVRPAIKQITSAHLPQLAVLSYNEITRDTRVESLAMVGIEG